MEGEGGGSGYKVMKNLGSFFFLEQKPQREARQGSGEQGARLLYLYKAFPFFAQI